MSTLNVADKPTLDSVLSETATLITRGGIRHNGTNPQVYDTTNDTWVDLPSGGSLSPTIIIKNHFYQDGDMDNLDITVTEPVTGWTTTQNMGTADKMIIAVPWFDEYELTCTFQQEYLDWKINVAGVGGVDGKFIPKIVSWSTGTDQEIADLVKWADRGVIDLATDAGWAVGDTRSVNISSIATSGTFDDITWSVSESHVAQTVDLVLMDVGKTSETGTTYNDTAASNYTLVTSVKNKDGTTRTNPAFIVGVKDVLSNKGIIESGNIDSSSTNWSNSKRRSWCNGAFMSSLPEILRPIFKQTNVITAQTYNGSTNLTTQDYCTLFAEKEIFGTRSYSNSTEANALKQIQWYKNSSNQMKRTDRGSGTNEWWWERSCASTTYFCAVNTDGTALNVYISNTYGGLSPMLFI